MFFPPLTREMLQRLHADPRRTVTGSPYRSRVGAPLPTLGVLFNFLGRYLQSLLLPQFLRERGNGKTHYARLTTTILGIRFFFRTATRAMNLFPRVSQDLKVKAGVTQVQGFPEFF